MLVPSRPPLPSRRSFTVDALPPSRLDSTDLTMCQKRPGKEWQGEGRALSDKKGSRW